MNPSRSPDLEGSHLPFPLAIKEREEYEDEQDDIGESRECKSDRITYCIMSLSFMYHFIMNRM